MDALNEGSSQIILTSAIYNPPTTYSTDAYQYKKTCVYNIGSFKVKIQ